MFQKSRSGPIENGVRPHFEKWGLTPFSASPSFFVTAAAVLLFASTSHAGLGDCGQPVTGGPKPTATDALAVLKAAVASISCSICVCDATGDDKITSGDALRVLQAAVGSDVELNCLACKNQTTIGASGGTLTSRDGSVSIAFPPGAVSQDTLVSIEGAPKSSLGAALFADGGAKAWRLEPDGLELSKDLTVTVNRDAAVLPGAGTIGVPLVLFLSKHDGALDALADQRVDLEGGEADATAKLDHFSILGVIPLKVTAKVSGVPSEIPPQQTHPVTATVTVGDSEKVVRLVSAHYVDDDFGAWQPTDGFAIDDPLEETISGLYGDSYDYFCTQPISVNYRASIVTALDVVADVPDPPLSIPTTMAFVTTIVCP